MTKRHFEALAAALKNVRPFEIIAGGPADTSQMRTCANGAYQQWRADVRAIAGVLIAHNPRFDTRFYAACGYETTEKNP